MHKRVGIFGGSFNPVTHAHILIGEQLLRKGYIDRISYVPCATSLHGKELAHPLHRYDMLFEAITESECHDKMQISMIEVNEKLSGRSIDLVDAITSGAVAQTYKPYMIIGMDNANNIQSFYKWEELIKSIPFIVLNRDEEVKQNWFLKDPHIFAEDIIIPKTSSTMVRNAIRDMKRDGLSNEFFNWCSWDVFRYIITERVY